jgi:hypothetical protein
LNWEITGGSPSWDFSPTGDGWRNVVRVKILSAWRWMPTGVEVDWNLRTHHLYICN